MLGLASMKKQVFGLEYLLVHRLLAHLAKLAQWLVQKARLKVNAPQKRLVRVLELCLVSILSGFAQQESEDLFSLVPEEMKLLDNSHLDYFSQMNLAQASDLSGSAWNLTL